MNILNAGSYVVEFDFLNHTINRRVGQDDTGRTILDCDMSILKLPDIEADYGIQVAYMMDWTLGTTSWWGMERFLREGEECYRWMDKLTPSKPFAVVYKDVVAEYSYWEEI